MYNLPEWLSIVFINCNQPLQMIKAILSLARFGFYFNEYRSDRGRLTGDRWGKLAKS